MKFTDMKVLKVMPAVAAVAAGFADAGAQPRPNVVIVIGDDVSYNDLSCYGAVNNVTPNIDALAADGMLFSRAYNSVSTSVPTRHCLYTGMYPIHNGGHYNHSSVRPDLKTFPVYLQELGYRVGLAGKWHVHPEEIFPFESVPGFQKNCLTKDPSHTMDGVREFIGRSREEPFCLVVASVNAHAPWTGGDSSKYNPDELVLPPTFPDLKSLRKDYADYLAEVDLLDREVGDVVDELKAQGLYDNTMLIFLSEQGTQLPGAKWTNWSPGVHAGVVVHWTGHVEPGRVSDALIQYEDILPTLIDAAGGKVPDDIDGRSLLGLLEGKTGTHRKYAFHLHSNIPSGPAYPIRAVSDGHYRLIWNMTPDSTFVAKSVASAGRTKAWRKSDDSRNRLLLERWEHRPEFELYDIDADPFEMTNLAGRKEYRPVQKRLFRALRKWMKQQNDPGADADTGKPSF